MGLQQSVKKKIIDGLKEAGNFEILGHLLIENSDEYIRELAAYALFRMSKLDGFYDFMDRTEIGFLDERTRKEIDAKFEEWGWRWELPKTENGKKSAILICYFSANWISKNRKELSQEILNQIDIRKRDQNDKAQTKSSLEQVDNRFRYLTTGFLVEKGIPFHEFDLIGFKYDETATKWGLKRYWEKQINLNNFWKTFLRGFAVLVVLALFGMHIIGIIGFVQYQQGSTTDNFFRFFFDPFTMNAIFFQSILFCVLTVILMAILRKYEHWMWSGLLVGGNFFFIMALIEISFISFTFSTRICCVVLSVGLSIASLFIPFHNFLFNIIFFLWFFILGILTIEANRWDIELIRFFGNIKYIYNFLHELESSK